MRPYLVILIFLSSTVFARYHEKTRFDRSIYDGKDVKNTDIDHPEKKWSFTDDVTQYIAYKNKKDNDCYLENIEQNQNILRQKQEIKVLYASTILTKLEAWRLAGGRIVDFCNGRSFILLEMNEPIPGQTLDPFLNEIPLDENDISSRRVADVVLTPLISRTRREIQLEQRETLNKKFDQQFRQRRQTNQFRGKFRGQTQSQYLNIGSGEQKEGKAEAESTQQSSRAVVSGSRGMGQAQSMSLGGTGCEDCPGYSSIEITDKLRVPTADGDRYQQGPSISTPGIMRPGTGIVPGGMPYPGGVTPGAQITYPGRVVPGQVGIYPGVSPGTRPGTYPGGVQPGVVSPEGVQPGTVIPGETYPGGVRPGVVTPSGDGTYPGGIRPGVMTPGGDGTYPGGVRPGVITPSGDGTYPGGVRLGVMTPSGDGTYPEGVRPGVMIPGGDGTYPGDVRPGVVTPGGDGMYPGGVRPGVITPSGDGTYPEGVRPRIVTPSGDGTYPGGVRPGVMTPGGDGTYPGGVRPGVITPSGVGTYPGGVRPGVVTPGVDGTYPGDIRPGVMTPGGDGTYPSGVRPGVVTPGGDGMYPGSVRPGIVTPNVDRIYPGDVRPGVVTPSGDGKYPHGTLITGGQVTYPGAVQPGRVPPGTTTTGIGTGVGTYPGIQLGVQPRQVTYPSGGVITSVTTGAAIIGTETYPSGIIPGTGRPGEIYPGGTLPIGTGETYPGTGIPGSVQPGTISRTGQYPGGVVPGQVAGQSVYPGGVQQTGAPYPGGVTGVTTGTIPVRGVAYPGSLVPGMITTTGSTADTGTQVISYPGSRPTDGQAVYPAPGSIIQPSRIPDRTGGTQVTYPGTGTYPEGAQVVYPTGTQQVIPPGGTLYPGQQVYPGDGRQVTTTYPGQPYPGTGIPGGAVVPGGTLVPGGTVVPERTQYPISTTGGQVTTGGPRISGQYPGQYPIGGQIGAPYPGVSGTGTGIGPDGTLQYTQIGAGRPMSMADDNAESQASSSVQQEGSGTQASASAQGRYGQGTAQSQVTGTYSGSGTFSAQAGTSDANKSAQTEISGGKEGATSNAQGVAGYGKSQVQVQLNSDSGATSTGAQSSGWNHGTNSQVQASSKGGMADAQANGEGSTSSQAQIGFQPYLKTDEKLEMHDSPFRGSGTASAQSGTHRGQSQSQLQGSFQYGITYTGAAQAGSGSGAASSRKPFNLNITNTELFKPFKPQNPMTKAANVGNSQSGTTDLSADYENRQVDREQGLQSSSTSRQTVVMGGKNNPEDPADKKILAIEKPRTDDTMYDEYDDDYADEYYDTTATTTTLTTTTINPISNGARAFTHQRGKVKSAQRQNHQAQVTQVIKGDQYDIHVSQDSNSPRTGEVLQPGQSLMGYTIPAGFRGRVMSISGTETIAQGDGKSQSQTVSLVAKNSTSTKSPATETRSLQTNHERHVDRHSSKSQVGSSFSQSPKSDKRTRPIPTSVAMKPSYYSVSNSVAGKINGSNAQKQYEHRYYTKSSTCGYFTFSCNVVYGSNGRTKICKPKAPTYPDGTPMRC